MAERTTRQANRSNETDQAQTPAANSESQEVVKHEISPAIILQADQKKSDIDIPDFLKEKDALQREAPEGFSPLIDFGDVAGKWIIAQYIGAKPNVGPNESMVYEFRVPQDDGKMINAALWGASILDTKFELLKPLALDWVFIQYLGVVPTKRRLNPAKDYRLAIVNPATVEKELKRMGFRK